MATYQGSNYQSITPQYRNPERTEFSDVEVRAWWETTVSGLQNDPLMDQNISSGANLYVYNDAGALVPDLADDELASDPAVQRRLMENSIDGRLFTREYGSSAPRQLVTTDDRPVEVGVTDAFFGEIDLPQPSLLPKPQHPGFLKYLLWPFS